MGRQFLPNKSEDSHSSVLLVEAITVADPLHVILVQCGMSVIKLIFIKFIKC